MWLAVTSDGGQHARLLGHTAAAPVPTVSHLVDELHALLLRPRPLRLPDRGGHPVIITPNTGQRGWTVTGAQPRQVASTGGLIWLLLQQCSEPALWRLVDRSRYQALFPGGSSLEWAPEPLGAWRPPLQWKGSSCIIEALPLILPPERKRTEALSA